VILIILWVAMAFAGAISSLGIAWLTYKQRANIPLDLRGVDSHLLYQALLRSGVFILMLLAGVLAALLEESDLRTMAIRALVVAAMAMLSFKSIDDFIVQYRYDRDSK
jgi:hypothetical protein